MQLQLRHVFCCAALCLAAFASAPSAKADSLTPILISVAPSGSDFRFTYNLTFTSSQGAERLQAGDFVTIYDIPGFVIAGSGLSGFTTNVQLVGITPSNTFPSDSPALFIVQRHVHLHRPDRHLRYDVHWLPYHLRVRRDGERTVHQHDDG